MTDEQAIKIANETVATLPLKGWAIVQGHQAGFKWDGEDAQAFLFPFDRSDPQSLERAVRAGYDMAFVQARVRALWPITSEKLIAWGNAYPFKGNADGMVEIKDEHGSFWVGSETARRWAGSDLS